jgi:hypothetical protein
VGVPVGPGALTKFLSANFSDIVHQVGKHGGDKLYWIGEAAGAAVRASDIGIGALGSEGAANLWAVFASPGLRQQMVFDRNTARFSVRPLTEAISETEVAIPPVTPEEFRVMAREFADSAPLDLKQELDNILERPEFIYQNWIDVLREKYPSQYHRWGLFRVQAITDLFRDRLTEAAIPGDQLEDTATRLAEAQSAAYKERLFARTRSVLYSEPGSWERSELRVAQEDRVSPTAKTAALMDPRSLAILAINNMSATEIRQLAIPIGALIDAGVLPRK